VLVVLGVSADIDIKKYRAKANVTGPRQVQFRVALQVAIWIFGFSFHRQLGW